MSERLLELGLVAGIAFAISYPVHWIRTRQLRDEVERYRTAFDLAPCPMWLKSPDRRIVAINEQFTEHFGLTMADYRQMRTADKQEAMWWNADAAAAFDETDRMAQANDEVVLCTRRLRAPKPERSRLRDPYELIEYAISKRRVPMRTAWGTSYGVIGSAISVQSVVDYQAKARVSGHASDDRNPILQAIGEMKESLSTEMRGGFAVVHDEIAAVKKTLEKHEREIGALFDKVPGGLADREQIETAMAFEGFEK